MSKYVFLSYTNNVLLTFLFKILFFNTWIHVQCCSLFQCLLHGSSPGEDADILPGHVCIFGLSIISCMQPSRAYLREGSAFITNQLNTFNSQLLSANSQSFTVRLNLAAADKMYLRHTPDVHFRATLLSLVSRCCHPPYPSSMATQTDKQEAAVARETARRSAVLLCGKWCERGKKREKTVEGRGLLWWWNN